MKKFSPGLCSVSFRQHTPEQIIKAVSEAGLECVEWGSDVHAPCDNEEAIESIVSLQKEYGITTSSYGTYFYLQKNTLDELRKYIKAAKMLGTDILRLWCGTKGSSEYTPDEKAEFFEECRRATKIAESENVRLCMEFHGGSYADSAESALELMEAINSPCFRMYWQPDIKGDEAPNLDSAKKLSDYTVNIHVHYWVDSKHYPLSDGIDKWTNYLSQFSENKCLLLEFMPDGKIETLPQQAKALKSIVDSQL